MKLLAVLFLTILVEGYVVLSTELIAIRQSMPFVGSGTETVSVIIAAILLPLAFGYEHGGRAYGKARGRGNFLSLRKRLVRNISIAMLILAPGLSYLWIEWFYETALPEMSITNRVAQIALYSALVLVYPTFLLGQTVPLITNYFKKHRLSEATGKILFFSTTGSFLGAITSTLLLMATIGVGQTVIVNMALLALIAFLLQPRRRATLSLTAPILALLVTTGFNNPFMLGASGIIADNTYNTIRIRNIPQEDARILEVNRTGAAKYAENEEFMFPYQYFVEHNLIEPLGSDEEKKDVLVLGAGGFIAGFNDDYNNYVFVDIDRDLKPISEEKLQRKPLGDNKQFEPEEARGFLVGDKRRYDLIILDVYSNIHSVPQHLMTREFLADLKSRLKSNGVLAANIVTTANFTEPFSIKFDNTFRAVFGHYTRQVVQDYNPWRADAGDYQNVFYIYYDRDYNADIYTDDRNTLFMDRAF
ncbi:MAG: fused MFS/spermidine synthase [Alphaproteobacteria bacterium]|nr:fused MFS/spermidine synthase [Alphaproteobacteria bacterium]